MCNNLHVKSFLINETIQFYCMLYLKTNVLGGKSESVER